MRPLVDGGGAGSRLSFSFSFGGRGSGSSGLTSSIRCVLRVRRSAHQPHQAHQPAAQARDAAGGPPGGQQRGREHVAGGAEEGRRWVLKCCVQMFLQHVPDQPKDGEPRKESEVLPGGPSPFHVLPLHSLDEPPDIIKLPSSGSTFVLSRQQRHR